MIESTPGAADKNVGDSHRIVKFTEQWRKWAAAANGTPKPDKPLDPRLFELPDDAHGFGLDQFVRKTEAVIG